MIQAGLPKGQRQQNEQAPQRGAHPWGIGDTLPYDFAQKQEFDHFGLSAIGAAQHIARFVSNVWRIHPFGEGDTRTTTVFATKHLRTKGYEVKTPRANASTTFHRDDMSPITSSTEHGNASRSAAPVRASDSSERIRLTSSYPQPDFLGTCQEDIRADGIGRAGASQGTVSETNMS
jgi:prophage maintenance system killer protein